QFLLFSHKFSLSKSLKISTYKTVRLLRAVFLIINMKDGFYILFLTVKCQKRIIVLSQQYNYTKEKEEDYA
ncbi:hypothetical protein OQG70_08960, partial [Streptococcus macedonicus]|uniref:hypothetical protein n=1 Tax=Streptococcus macedonicus TaxID=59310 RepID=UPI002243AACC